MRGKPIATGLAGAVVLGLQGAARACQFCASDTGRQIRAGIWNTHFLGNALLVVAPFPVFAGVIYCLYVGTPLPRRPRAKDDMGQATGRLE